MVRTPPVAPSMAGRATHSFPVAKGGGPSARVGEGVRRLGFWVGRLC